jgi:hypothetical protein
MTVAVVFSNHHVCVHVAASLKRLGVRAVLDNRRFPQDVHERVDLIVIKSWRQRQRRIAAMYPDKPILVLDWGYFARVNKPDDWHKGYWQISNRQLNAMPEGKYPMDRFEATGCEIKTRKHKPDGYVLVCGQMPLDAAVMGTDHGQWLREQIKRYRDQGHDVRYREHPRGGVEIKDIPLCQGPLDQALDGAKFIVCYNSNVAHEALLMGVPVVCDPCAPYAELSGETIPTKAKRQAYFSRAAYGQWKVSEFDQGFKFWLGRLGIE